MSTNYIKPGIYLREFDVSYKFIDLFLKETRNNYKGYNYDSGNVKATWDNLISESRWKYAAKGNLK